MQQTFILTRPHKRVAIPFREKVPDQAADPILFLRCIARASLIAQAHFQILPLRKLVALLIPKLKSEVPQHPKESREVLRDLICVVAGFPLSDLELLAEVDHETQVSQSVLVD